jgi:hypothetical protein
MAPSSRFPARNALRTPCLILCFHVRRQHYLALAVQFPSEPFSGPVTRCLFASLPSDMPVVDCCTFETSPSGARLIVLLFCATNPPAIFGSGPRLVGGL